jgi:hypothetical protein
MVSGFIDTHVTQVSSSRYEKQAANGIEQRRHGIRWQPTPYLHRFGGFVPGCSSTPVMGCSEFASRLLNVGVPKPTLNFDDFAITTSAEVFGAPRLPSRLLEGQNLMQMSQVLFAFYSCSMGWGEAPLV